MIKLSINLLTNVRTKYIIINVRTKERGDLMSPKGRPTDNPKKGRFEIRTSQEEEEMLNYCCEITGKKRTDIVRLGIRKVYEELKK